MPNKLDVSELTGTVPVANGGTGAANLAVNGVVFGNTTAAVGVTAAGTQYQVLTAGATGIPAYGAVALDQADATSGSLPIGSGGTGVTAFGAGKGVLGNAAGTGTAAIPVMQLVAYKVGVNMNSTADQLLTMSATVPTGSRILLDTFTVINASTSLTTAVGGLYTAVSKGGVTLVPASQAYSTLTTSAKTLALTTDGRWLTALPAIYVSLTIAQGVAATADFYVFGTVIPAS